MDDLNANPSSSGVTSGANLTTLANKLSLSPAESEQLSVKFPNDTDFAALVAQLGKLPAEYYPVVKSKLLSGGFEAALVYVNEILTEIAQKRSAGRSEGGRGGYGKR